MILIHEIRATDNVVVYYKRIAAAAAATWENPDKLPANFRFALQVREPGQEPIQAHFQFFETEAPIATVGAGFTR